MYFRAATLCFRRVSSLLVIFGVCSRFSFSSASAEKANLDTLKLVQVLFRHGDRAPTGTYPTDPYKDLDKFWPEGLGQLTDRGKMQHYNLGRYFRERYHGFLAIKYSHNEVYAMSSDMDRTIMSAESNLAGLFPPVNKWNPEIDWQPIPIRTIPSQHDRYLHIHEYCPRVTWLNKEFRNSEVVQRTNEENRDFIQYVATKAGLTVEEAMESVNGSRGNITSLDVESIVFLQDILFVQSAHNLSLPSWVYTHDVISKLNKLQTTVSIWHTYTPEMKRLRGGPLLELFLKNMQIKAGIIKEGKKKQRKMYVYSAHDSTLVRLMNTMGIFQPHNPPYAAALIIELHKRKNGPYFVEIFYKNDTSGHPLIMHYPECGSPCLLGDMMRLAQPFIPNNWEQECKLLPSDTSSGLRASASHSDSVVAQLMGTFDELGDDEMGREHPDSPVIVSFSPGLLSNTGILIFCGVFAAVIFLLWVTILRNYVFPPVRHPIIDERPVFSKSSYSYFGYETI